MTEARDASGRGRSPGQAGFRWGLAAGVLVCAAGIALALVTPEREPPRAAVSFDLFWKGSELGAAGARRVVVSTEEGELSQTCQGGCDTMGHRIRGQSLAVVKLFGEAQGAPILSQGIPGRRQGAVRAEIVGGSLKVEPTP